MSYPENPLNPPKLSARLHTALPMFNRAGKEYYALVGNMMKEEAQPVVTVNDINTGAIQNAVEWHRRFQRRAVFEAADVRRARTFFLRIWSDITGIEPPSGMTEEEFAVYILARVTGGQSASQTLPSIIPEEWTIIPTPQLGAFADHFYSDVGVLDPRNPESEASSVTTSRVFGIYVLVPIQDAHRITTALSDTITAAMPSGTAVYFGLYEPEENLP